MFIDISSLIITIIFYIFWVNTQKIFSKRSNAQGEIPDKIHNSDLGIYIFNYLKKNQKFTKYLTIACSLIIDILGVWSILRCLFLGMTKSILALMITLIIRQFIQAVDVLPIPKEMIWINPNFPSLFVTYSTNNDFFFSGHTAFAVGIFFDMWSYSSMFGKIFSFLVMILEISFVLFTRSHYTIDIYGAIITYGFIYLLI